MKNYRIGELSKYLGVTPDFIKYYEKEGLITSIPETSPKLYPFNQSSKILECIKLKNLGFTAKEMQDYLFSDTLKDYRETKQELDYETRKKHCLHQRNRRLPEMDQNLQKRSTSLFPGNRRFLLFP